MRDGMGAGGGVLHGHAHGRPGVVAGLGADPVERDGVRGAEHVVHLRRDGAGGGRLSTS